MEHEGGIDFLPALVALRSAIHVYLHIKQQEGQQQWLCTAPNAVSTIQMMQISVQTAVFLAALTCQFAISASYGLLS